MTDPAATLEFGLLGPLEVTRGGVPIAVPGRKLRSLLAILLLRANEVVSSDRLIDELWGERAPGTADNTLQVHVSQLRKTLGAGEILRTERPGYRLEVAPEQLDSSRFERRVAAGRDALARGDPEAAAAQLRDGLELWRGPALADFAFEAFAAGELGRLEELRLAAIEERIEAELALGRQTELVPELELLTAQNPLRERLRAQLMLALYRSGRQAEALEVYRTTRRLLVEELGIEPGLPLQRLERSILGQDQALAAPARPPAAAAVEPEGDVRKTVTVLCAELSVSGTGPAALDPEAYERFQSRAGELLSECVTRHGGRAEELRGGGVLGVFGVPRLHEDDALRALRAATDALGALDGLSDDSAVVAARIGVATGGVLARRGGARLAGEPLEASAQLARAAAPGSILLDDVTRGLTANAVRLRRAKALAGRGRAAPVWRLAQLLPGAPAVDRQLDAPLVGRTLELAQLRQAFDRTRRSSTSYLFTVLGPAGIGKTRLASELRSAVQGEAAVLAGRCLSYGEGITFWPLAEVVRQAVGDEVERGVAEALAGDDGAEEAAAAIAGALGVGKEAGTREGTFWAVRRLLEALAGRRPLVVILDDLHWAEPTFLDLVEHVIDFARSAPILILCLARPELIEQRPAWGGGKANAATMLLEPLSEQACEALMENLEGASRLAPEERRRIARAAEGNPLFIEQLLALLSERGALEGELPLPPTIQALLAARLDRLEAGERRLLQHASVVGKEFGAAAVADLTGDAAESALALLSGLVRKELIRPAPTGTGRGESFRFRHLLIRDAAYESLPKAERAGLHERLAASLEETSAGTNEYDELLGYHLEQAARLLGGLEPGGERARSLAERAASTLGAAGRRAYARGDMRAAAGLLSRAVALLPGPGRDRLELLPDLGEALREVGDLKGAGEVLEQAEGEAGSLSESALAAYVRLLRLRMRMQTDPGATTQSGLEAAAEEAIGLHSELGDERRVAKSWFALAFVPWQRCQAGRAEEALEQAIAHARSAGDDRTEAEAMSLLTGALYFGPTPVERAVSRCEEILARVPQGQRVAASALRALAGFRAMQGMFDEARDLLARQRRVNLELGHVLSEAAAGVVYGTVELLAGEPAAAEREVRRSYETLEEMGELAWSSDHAALLAETLYAQERYEDAQAFSELSERSTTDEDLSTQVQWRATRAKVLARRGQATPARALAGEAVSLAAKTDFLNLRGDAALGLVEVLALAGQAGEASRAVRQAVGLYRRKGNVVSAARARTFQRAIEAARASGGDVPLAASDK